MGICLNMIVKDEAARLPRLLATLECAVDACVVSDTGSSDATLDIIQAWAARHQIPCLVIHHPWVDFAVNRNLALQEACRARDAGMHDCSWLMVIDADETLHVTDPEWKASLVPGLSYAVHVRGELDTVIRSFLLDISDTKWHWQGRVHNWVERSGVDGGLHFVPGVQVRVRGHEGAKSHPFVSTLAKADCDRKLLLEELAGSLLTASNSHRWFQLAYACLLSGRHEEASDRMARILHQVDVHPEVRYAAAILACRSAWAGGKSPAVVNRWLAEACAIEPHRWEAPYYQALLLEAIDPISALSLLSLTQKTLPSLEGAFWMQHDVYEWKLFYERVILLFRNGQSQEAATLAESMLALGSVPEAAAGFLTGILQRVRVNSI